MDSDLDWGQDMARLATELQRRHVAYFHMACLYTGDDTRLGLPAWDSLEPYQPVTGWVAVSQTMLKNYGWMVAQQRGRPDLAFAWLDQYQPVGACGQIDSALLHPGSAREGSAIAEAHSRVYARFQVNAILSGQSTAT